MRQWLFYPPISDEVKVPLLKGMYLVRGKAKFQTPDLPKSGAQSLLLNFTSNYIKLECTQIVCSWLEMLMNSEVSLDLFKVGGGDII